MKTIFLKIFLVFYCQISVVICTETDLFPPIPADKVFYYTATHSDTGTELRILGSCHIYPLEKIDAATIAHFCKGQMFFTEIKINLSQNKCSLLSPYSLDALSKAGLYLGESQEHLYPDDLRVIVSEKYESRFMAQWGVSAFDFHPVVLDFIFERSFQYKKDHLQAIGEGMDYSLEKQFIGGDKLTEALETVEERACAMKILDALSEKCQDYAFHFERMSIFYESMSNLLTHKKVLNTDLSHYIDGNMNHFQLLQDSALHARNIIWMRTLKEYLNSHSTLKTASIVVGVAHLPGRFGLLNLLKKQGFTITRGIPTS